MTEIVKQLGAAPPNMSSEFYQKYSLLCDKLSKVKGKKVYGYLDKPTKNLVNDLVKMISQTKELSELYDLWYKCQCETYKTYTDVMPEKIPLEQNETFKSLRNQIVKTAAELGLLGDCPTEYEYYDNGVYDDLSDSYVEYKSDYENDRDAMFRYGQRLLKTDKDEAEYYLQKAAEQGQVYAMFRLYRLYKNGTLHGDAMKYLLMAVDKNFGAAEYEYALYLKDKSRENAFDYLIRAAKHGSYQADYQIGKMYLEDGNREDAIPFLERAASQSHWAKTQLGILYYYQLGEEDKGWDYISEEAMRYHYEPAEKAWNAIQDGLNAQIFVGICDLLYYAGSIIDERTDYDSEQDEGLYVDRRARQQDRAKRQGIVMSM